jgi:hypothetical protein|tara:strand:+ start:1701 stop:2459 length:759 start_codon:yes stop_codon:yes gene_type:complete
MKTALIYQPCGLGDILFLQKAAYFMKEAGYEVWWPVVHEFKWLSDYIPDFNFVSWGDDDSPVNGSTQPVPQSCQFPHREEYVHGAPSKITDDLFFFQGFGDYKPIMAGKYDHVGLDWSDWRDYVLFNRNKEKEDELYYKVLGLNDDSTYVLVNRYWCTRPKIEICDRISVNPDDYGGAQVVETRHIPGYTLFDWCKVIEKAAGYNFIETAWNYLFESPELFSKVKDKPMFLHHRWGNWTEVQYLFNLPWKYL